MLQPSNYCSSQVLQFKCCSKGRSIFSQIILKCSKCYQKLEFCPLIHDQKCLLLLNLSQGPVGGYDGRIYDDHMGRGRGGGTAQDL